LTALGVLRMLPVLQRLGDAYGLCCLGFIFFGTVLSDCLGRTCLNLK